MKDGQVGYSYFVPKSLAEDENYKKYEEEAAKYALAKKLVDEMPEDVPLIVVKSRKTINEYHFAGGKGYEHSIQWYSLEGIGEQVDSAIVFRKIIFENIGRAVVNMLSRAKLIRKPLYFTE